MAKTVLIVDDSASMRQAVSWTLSRAGYMVVETCNGADGVAKAKLLGRELGLVLTDLNMPHMDGLEVVEEVRKLPELALIPVLILSTECRAELLSRAKAAGAAGWVTKPFSPGKLIESVSRLIGS